MIAVKLYNGFTLIVAENLKTLERISDGFIMGAFAQLGTIRTPTGEIIEDSPDNYREVEPPADLPVEEEE